MPVNIIDEYGLLGPSLFSQLKTFGLSLLRAKGKLEYTVNFAFTNDETIKGLNNQYRNINKPTNVLSFPFASEDEPILHLPVKELGDVVISVETAEKEAAELYQPLQYRLSWLVTHGFLHLLGYDHERSSTDAEVMFKEEKNLMDSLHISRREKMIDLAINVDHVATLRQARGITEPDPVVAAGICELAGAKGIVVHLREDRRHIQDRDVRILRETVQTKLNLEMGAAKEIIAFALDIKPDMVTLVPEKREELTTEGGLDVVSQKKKIAKTIKKMNSAGIPVSLFIDPDPAQIETACDIGATFVEIHTGAYAEAKTSESIQQELALIQQAAAQAAGLGLRVNAGHGLNYVNTAAIAAIDKIEELSIGHAVIGRAVFSGLDQAVKDMQEIIFKAASFRSR